MSSFPRARKLILFALTTLVAAFFSAAKEETETNILFAFADDWGWPHAGAYGDPVVKTPTFDRLAKEGALFHHAYVSSPSCTPSRGAVLTGKYHWELEGAGNLWSVFPDKFDTYPELLGKKGYATGVSSKGWGPGRTATGGRQLVGPRFKNFPVFLKQKPKGKPFCYWLGSSDPHRGYAKGSGKKSGMDLSKIKLFAHYPDSPEVRGDVADYYFEVQRFDRLVGDAIKALEESGELDNTIIVMSGDHGMPFPRCKSNNYDSGARVPLAIRWPAKIKAGAVVNDFVSLVDLAPTFYETAGVSIPSNVTGRSLLPLLAGKDKGDRSFVIHGKERHVPGQEKPDVGGYPTRAIRTHDFLYLHNFKPDRWPAGTPHYKKAAVSNAWLADCDNGPTKTYMVNNREKDDHHRKLYDLAFGKRPADELYGLKKDPGQLVNVAADPAYAETVKKLKDQLFAELRKTGDPRVTGKGSDFDKFPYLGGAPKFPGPRK
jgi:N-sulfoglucosamine sulfohydrolase